MISCKIAMRGVGGIGQHPVHVFFQLIGSPSYGPAAGIIRVKYSPGEGKGAETAIREPGAEGVEDNPHGGARGIDIVEDQDGMGVCTCIPDKISVLQFGGASCPGEVFNRPGRMVFAK